VKYGKRESLDERRSGMIDKQGRRIEDNSTSGKNPPLNALEHHTKGKERQAGEARKKRVKLT
jgi:hypothetical protein